jgi:hypothetical protein
VAVKQRFQLYSCLFMREVMIQMNSL